MKLFGFLRQRRRASPRAEASSPAARPRRRQGRQHRAFDNLAGPSGSYRKTREPELERYRQAVSMQWTEARDISSRLDLELLDEAMRMDDELNEWERKEMSPGRPLHRWWISAPNFPVREEQLLDWWEVLHAAQILMREPLFDLFLEHGELARKLRTMFFWGFRRGYAIAVHEVGDVSDVAMESGAPLPQAFRDAFAADEE